MAVYLHGLSLRKCYTDGGLAFSILSSLDLANNELHTHEPRGTLLPPKRNNYPSCHVPTLTFNPTATNEPRNGHCVLQVWGAISPISQDVRDGRPQTARPSTSARQQGGREGSRHGTYRRGSCVSRHVQSRRCADGRISPAGQTFQVPGWAVDPSPCKKACLSKACLRYLNTLEDTRPSAPLPIPSLRQPGPSTSTAPVTSTRRPKTFYPALCQLGPPTQPRRPNGVLNAPL